MSDVDEQIRMILDPILVSMGLSLWEFEFHKQGPKWLLRIYIDRESDGVTLNDCEAVSRDLGAILDVEDIIPHAYTLEVSSPGLDRALTKAEHFIRFVGSRVRIKTYKAIEGEKVFHGKLIGLENEAVKLEREKEVVLEIPSSNIAKASLEVEF